MAKTAWGQTSKGSKLLRQLGAGLVLVAYLLVPEFASADSPPNAAQRWSNDKGMVGVLSGTALFLPSSTRTGPAAPQLSLGLGPNFSLWFKPSLEFGWASVPLDTTNCPGCGNLDVFHVGTRVRLALAYTRLLYGADLGFGLQMPGSWVEGRRNHPSAPHSQIAVGGFLWLTSSERATIDLERVRGIEIERLAQGYKDSCKAAADAAAGCKSTLKDIEDLVENRRRSCTKPTVNYADGLDDAELNGITDYGICIQEAGAPELSHTGIGLSLRLAYTTGDDAPYRWSLPLSLELVF